MILGRRQGNEQWQIVVTLNGRHLDDRLVTAGDVALDISLPGNAPSRHNVIEVTASSARVSRDICDRGPELLAEVVHGTDLLPGPQTFRDSLSDLTDPHATRLDSEQRSAFFCRRFGGDRASVGLALPKSKRQGRRIGLRFAERCGASGMGKYAAGGMGTGFRR